MNNVESVKIQDVCKNREKIQDYLSVFLQLGLCLSRESLSPVQHTRLGNLHCWPVLFPAFNGNLSAFHPRGNSAQRSKYPSFSPQNCISEFLNSCFRYAFTILNLLKNMKDEIRTNHSKISHKEG
jgi:hypothetical protein